MQSRIVAHGLLSLFTLFALLSCAEVARSAEYYVATHGSNSNSGTRSRPFATICRARDVIRALPHPISENIVVWIGGGTYAIDQPIVFGPEDTGTTIRSITYQGMTGQSVLISGGRPITNWVQHAGNIWKAQLPEVANGSWYFRYLWANGRRLTRSRQPNDPQMWKIAELSPDFLQVRLDYAIPTQWNFSKKDIELVLETEWTNSRDIVDHVSNNWLYMKSTVGLVNNPNVCAKVGNRAFLENAYEFLDQPGEWYLDKASGMLYCYLASGTDPNTMEFVASKAPQLLKVVGLRATPVVNLHFRNLRFSYTDWQLPAEGYAGIQACVYASGWYRPDEGVERHSYMMPLAVSFEFARNCGLERCAVRSVAGIGLGLTRGCQDNLIQGCEVADVAANGVQVGWIEEIPKAGWYYWWSVANMQTWDVNRRNTIANSYIHDIGQEFWEGVGSIDMFAQATHYLHNEIAYTGSAGMVIGYCWDPITTPESDTLAEANNVHHFCQKLGDNGGIYTLGFNANAVIRGNYIHHNMRRPPSLFESPAFGIYYDQASRGWRAENNVLYLVQTPGFARAWNEPVNINVTKQNAFRNNFIHCHDTGLFRFSDTPLEYLTQDGNITLTCATDLTLPAVRKVILNAGPEPDYRAILKPNAAAQLLHAYSFDDSAGHGRDSVGKVPMWLDHGPYTWPVGVTGRPGDHALGLSGNPGVSAGINYEYFKQDLGDRFSLAMWIKPAEKTTFNNMQCLMSNARTGTPYHGFKWTLNGFTIIPSQPDDGMLGFQTSDSVGQTAPFSSAGAITADGGWQHVAVVVDKVAGTVKCYAKGVQVLDGVLETYFVSNQKYLFVGSIGHDYNFKGAIDDVRIYRGLLSEAELKKLALPHS